MKNPIRPIRLIRLILPAVLVATGLVALGQEPVVHTLDLHYKLSNPAARYLIANAEGFGKGELAVRAPEGGEETLAMDYAFENDSQTGVLLGLWNVQEPHRNAVIPMPFEAVRMDVYGDGSGNVLRAEFADDLRREFCYNFGRVDWKGWKTVSIPMPTEVRRIAFADAYQVWTDAQSQRDMADPQPGWQQRMDEPWPTSLPAGPLQLRFIGLIQARDPETGAGKPSSGTIFFRNLAVDTPADALDGLEIAGLHIYRPGNLFRGHVKVNSTYAVEGTDRPGCRGWAENGNGVEIVIVNHSSRPLSCSAQAVSRNLFGETFEGPRRDNLFVSPGMTVRRFVYMYEGLSDGWYETIVTLSAEGAAPRTASIAMGRIGAEPLSDDQVNGFFGMSMAVLDEGFRIDSPATLDMADLANTLGVMCYRAYDWFPGGGPKQVHHNAQYKLTKMYDKDCISVLWPWEEGWDEEGEKQFAKSIPEYEEYARTYGGVYGDRVRFYQNQNEPYTYYGYSPTFVAHRLGPFYKAIHAGCPNAVVIGPNTHINIPLDTTPGWKWLEAYFQKGGLNFVDRLGICPLRFISWGPRGEYPEKKDEEALAYQKLLNEDLATHYAPMEAVERLPTVYDAAVDLMKKYGGEKPIHLTEVGLPGVGFLTPGTRAELSSKTILHSLAHPAVVSMLWRRLLNGNLGYDAESIVDDSLGKNLAVTPTAVAYAILTTELGDVKTAAETIVRDDAAKTFVYKFSGPRGEVVAAWSDTPGVTIKVAGGARTLDIMGRDLGSSEGGRELTDSPVLIRGAEKLAVERM